MFTPNFWELGRRFVPPSHSTLDFSIKRRTTTFFNVLTSNTGGVIILESFWLPCNQAEKSLDNVRSLAPSLTIRKSLKALYIYVS